VNNLLNSPYLFKVSPFLYESFLALASPFNPRWIQVPLYSTELCPHNLFVGVHIQRCYIASATHIHSSKGVPTSNFTQKCTHQGVPFEFHLLRCTQMCPRSVLGKVGSSVPRQCAFVQVSLANVCLSKCSQLRIPS
jgi:hypothetical protein